MVGDGQQKTRLIDRAIKLNLKNMEFRNAVPKREIYKELEQADLLLHHCVNLPVYKYGLSGLKVYDYMASGRPIIFAADGLNNPIDDAKAGITVPAENPRALARGILHIISLDRRERVEMGKNGIEYVKANYNTRLIAQNLEKTLYRIVSEFGGN